MAPAMAKSTAETMPIPEWAGTGPDFAMAPNDEWQSLDPGAYHWYKFTFDENEDWTEPLAIRLYTDPANAAILTVRNGDQAEAWRQEGVHKHFRERQE